MIRAPAVAAMDDETFISHLELRHPGALRMHFRPEPGRTERRMLARFAWEVYHTRLHEATAELPHQHKERA